MRISDWSSDVCSSDLTLTIGRVLAARGNTEVVPQGATSTRGTILRRIGASALTVVLLVGELAHVLDVVLRRARAQRRGRCRSGIDPGRGGRRRGRADSTGWKSCRITIDYPGNGRRIQIGRAHV